MNLLILLALMVPPIFPPTGVYADHKPNALVMFTASYCGPCQVWKRTVMPKLERDGITVILIDVTQAGNQAYGIKRLPTFWVVDGDTYEWKGKALIGSQTDTVLKSKLRDPGTTTDPPPVKLTRRTPTASRQRSQAELIQLHNALHGGGQWTWHGDLRTHLIQVHGVNP